MDSKQKGTTVETETKPHPAHRRIVQANDLLEQQHRAADRPVRVTIMGTAHPVLDNHGKPTSALRVRYDGPDRETSTLLHTGAAGVTVEYVAPARVWTDGDVVQAIVGNCPPITLTRWSGFWTCAGDGVHREDETVTRWVDCPPTDDWTVTVLRYQAGEL